MEQCERLLLVGLFCVFRKLFKSRLLVCCWKGLLLIGHIPGASLLPSLSSLRCTYLLTSSGKHLCSILKNSCLGQNYFANMCICFEHVVYLPSAVLTLIFYFFLRTRATVFGHIPLRAVLQRLISYLSLWLVHV